MFGFDDGKLDRIVALEKQVHLLSCDISDLRADKRILTREVLRLTAIMDALLVHLKLHTVEVKAHTALIPYSPSISSGD